MPKIKAELMTTQIKFYLRQCVTKAGPEPTLLPSEEELCKRFNVARGTVRDAIAQLKEWNSVMHIPGRRGLFSNPKESDPQVILVGLIHHGCYGFPSEFPAEASLVLSTLFQNMPGNVFYNNIMFPENFTEDDLFLFFKNQNLDLMLWLEPDRNYMPLISRLWENQIPIFVTTIYNKLTNLLPSSSRFVVSVETNTGLQVLHLLSKMSFNKLLVCIGKEIENLSYMERIHSSISRNMVIFHHNESSPEELIHLLQNDQAIDTIYADGGFYMRNSFLMNAIRQSGRSNLKIILEDNGYSQLRKKEFPELDIILTDHKPVVDSLLKAGVETAKQMTAYVIEKRKDLNS